ncbi:MAG: hypothetical protein ABWY57_11690 [Mycetocola sp.]
MRAVHVVAEDPAIVSASTVNVGPHSDPTQPSPTATGTPPVVTPRARQAIIRSRLAEIFIGLANESHF